MHYMKKSLTDMTQDKFIVGQELYCERRGEDRRMVKIVKIGRRWLELSDHQRVDKDTLKQDTKYTPNLYYLDRSAREVEVATQNAWSGLRNKIYTQHLPLGVTLEKITQAAAMLGIELRAGAEKGL